MADGSINIDINIPVSKAISDIGDLQKSISKLTDKDIEVKVSQAQAEEKVNDLVQMLSKVPENKRVQLYARAEKAGINSFSELLSALPKEKQTELLAKVEKNQAINWKSYLDELPKEKRTELTAKAETAGITSFEDQLRHVPERKETELVATDHASRNIGAVKINSDSAGSSMSSLGTIMKGTFLGGAILKGISSITEGLKEMTSQAITSFDSLKTYEQTMEFAGIDKKKIEESKEALKEYSAATIYNVGEMSNTTATLAANGVKNFEGVTESLGNLVAVAGGGSQAMSSASLALTQIVGAGKMYTGDWNQFINMIPGASKKIQNALKDAGAYTGNFRDAMSKGKISSEEMIAAIEKLGNTKVAEKAATDTSKFSTAWQGMQENVQDAILSIMDAIGTGGITGGLTKIADGFQSINDYAKNNKKQIQQWRDNFVQAIKPLGTVIKSVADLVGSFVKSFVSGFQSANKATKGLNLSAVVKGFKDLSSAIQIATKFLTPFVKYLGNIAGRSVAAAIKITITAFQQFAKVTKDVTDVLGDLFSGNWKKLFKDLQKTFKDGMKGLYKLWKVGWEAIVDIVSAITKPLRKVVTKLLDSLGDWVSDKWSDIKKNTSKSWENIKDTISDRLEETKSSSIKLAGHIASAVADKWNELHSNSSKIWGNISSTIVRLVQRLKRSLDGIFNAISSAWSNLWSGLGSIFISVWSGVKGAVRDGMNAVIDFINGGINGVNSVISFFGGKKNTISTIKKLATGTSAVNERQLAVVNDEKATDYREAIFRANGQVEIPEGRDVLTVLNPGDSVMPAQATKAMFPHYANGVGDWLSAAWNNIKNWAGDTYEAIKEAISNPLGTLQNIFNKPTNNAKGIYREIADGVGSYLPKVGADWFKKQLEKMKEALSIENVSGDADAWIPVIKRVADRMNVELTSGGLSAILRRINQESGGSATVTNNWDSNAKAGHPSKGLLQYIQPTLSAWAATTRGFGANLSSGADQLAAMFNDSNWLRDISVSGGWGPTGHRRYANGGWANQASIFGEDGAEVAINPSKQTADSLILQAIRARAIADPKGMSAKLNALVERSKIGQISSFRAVQPNIDDSPSQVAKGLNTENNSVSGNVKLNIQLDSKIIAKATYPLQKAMEAREITILQNGGAIPSVF